MQTIRYDGSVKNLIAAVNETEKVTHINYKKKSITFHGSGGRLTHDLMLAAWKHRGISMQFAVDSTGNIAQGVAVEEYAWAVGENQGNQESIHIEMAETLDGVITIETLKAAARLVGWLFVYAINDHPYIENILTHDHWAKVNCPNAEFYESVHDVLIGDVQGWYVYFRNQQHGPTTFSVVEKDPLVIEQIKKIQETLGIKVNGVWGPDMDDAVLEFRRKNRRR